MKIEVHGSFIFRYWTEEKPGEKPCWVNFEVFDGPTDTDGKYYLKYREDEVRVELTDDLDKAVRFFKGSIKWDGCQNWDFFPDDGGYVHFCENPANDFKMVFDKIFEISERIMGKLG